MVTIKEKRLVEIIHMAHDIGWLIKDPKEPYPLMSLSEVEKCMLAMVDNEQFGRMKQWQTYKELTKT